VQIYFRIQSDQADISHPIQRTTLGIHWVYVYLYQYHLIVVYSENMLDIFQEWHGAQNEIVDR